MRLTKSLAFSGALALAAMSGGWSVQAAIIIDDFNGGAQTISVGPGDVPMASIPKTFTAPEVNYAGAIGGYREVSSVVTDITTPALARTLLVDINGVDPDTGLGSMMFTHNQGSTIKAYTVIKWDGLGSAGLGGLDLTQGGILTAFKIDFIYADQGIEWNLRVTDTSGEVADDIFNSAANINSPTTLYRLLSNFTDDNAAVDLTSIASIEFFANYPGSQFGVDTVIDMISVIPEPATLALFGAGLFGLGIARRRKAA